MCDADQQLRSEHGSQPKQLHRCRGRSKLALETISDLLAQINRQSRRFFESRLKLRCVIRLRWGARKLAEHDLGLCTQH